MTRIPASYKQLTWGRPCSLQADVFYALRIRREQRRVMQRAEQMLK